MIQTIHRFLLIIAALLFFSCEMNGQLKPDTTYRFSFSQYAYNHNEGSVVCIDAAHNNLHTQEAGFYAFAKLLEDDGYRIQPMNRQITHAQVLKGCSLLVIANALHHTNKGNWVLPTPSAFTRKEIDVLRQWVLDGGHLLLIADHMPFAGAAADLAAVFGFEFLNGFAMTGDDFWPPSQFTRQNSGLSDSPPASGIKSNESVDSVATFTGSAFTIPDVAIPVLSFTDNHISLQPDTAWSFHSDTPSSRLGGYHQGALLQFGEGRVAVFGEAAMFTAQIANGGSKAGFNSAYAPQNAQFVLNVIHWLDALEEYAVVVSENPSSTTTKNTALSKDAEAILAVNREMEKAFNANEMLRVASFYADNAVMVGNRHEVKGREAIDAYWGSLIDRGVSWELENVDLEVHGQVAFQRGISAMKFLHDGKERLSEVRFTLVWKKMNNNWLIVTDQYSLY